MAYSNGYQTVIQSMNGILSFNDGSGTIIENGTISTQSIALNNIPAVLPTASVTLWNNLITASAFIMNSLTTGTIYLGTALGAGVTGTLRLGNSVCTVVLGSFTFLSNSIQTSLNTTLDLFTTYTGTTLNFFTGMAGSSGTIVNLFSGIGQGNVRLCTGMNGAGVVTIGNSSNANQIGTIEIVNNKILPITGGTIILEQTQRLGYSIVSRINPASYTVKSTYVSASQMNVTTDFICGGSTLRNFDVRQSVETNGAQVGDGRGILTTTCRTNQFLFNGGTIVPKPNPLINAIEIGYTNTQDDGCFLNAGGPFGGISLGGCGQSNPTYTTAYQRAMTVYPHYGTRLYTGGLSFDKGNLTSSLARGFFIQSGRYLNVTNIIAANGSRTQTVTFTTAFGGTPTVTLGPIGSSGSGPVSVFIYTIYDVVAGQFSVLIRNSQGVPNIAGSPFGFNWIAIGAY